MHFISFPFQYNFPTAIINFDGQVLSGILKYDEVLKYEVLG